MNKIINFKCKTGKSSTEMQNDHEQTWKRESERDVSFHKKKISMVKYTSFL